MNDMVKKLAEKLKKPKVLMAVGLSGILLIFLSSFGKSDSKAQNAQTVQSFSAETYRAETEEAISRLVSEITGSKDVSVVVTLENTVSYSYADKREESSSDKSGEDAAVDTSLKEDYIIVRTADGGEQALLVTANMPQIRGVAIVCGGGDNPDLNQKILNAVTAALDITKKRVYICGRKTR